MNIFTVITNPPPSHIVWRYSYYHDTTTSLQTSVSLNLISPGVQFTHSRLHKKQSSQEPTNYHFYSENSIYTFCEEAFLMTGLTVNCMPSVKSPLSWDDTILYFWIDWVNHVKWSLSVWSRVFWQWVYMYFLYSVQCILNKFQCKNFCCVECKAFVNRPSLEANITVFFWWLIGWTKRYIFTDLFLFFFYHVHTLTHIYTC